MILLLGWDMRHIMAYLDAKTNPITGSLPVSSIICEGPVIFSAVASPRTGESEASGLQSHGYKKTTRPVS